MYNGVSQGKVKKEERRILDDNLDTVWNSNIGTYII